MVYKTNTKLNASRFVFYFPFFFFLFDFVLCICYGSKRLISHPSHGKIWWYLHQELTFIPHHRHTLFSRNVLYGIFASCYCFLLVAIPSLSISFSFSFSFHSVQFDSFFYARLQKFFKYTAFVRTFHRIIIIITRNVFDKVCFLIFYSFYIFAFLLFRLFWW